VGLISLKLAIRLHLMLIVIIKTKVFFLISVIIWYLKLL